MRPIPSPPNEIRLSVSVLTLARGRDEHLYNLVLGLNAQTQPPSELIIAVMQDRCYESLPATKFPVHQIHVPGDELPLAAARNRVAAAAIGDVLAFVDVDCIPAPSLVADYAKVTEEGMGLVMGEVLYLPSKAVAKGLDFVTFDILGQRHAERAGPPNDPLGACEDYRCFWSLNFSMHRDDWALSGGFDPAYTGYGGEDTDFGRTLHELGIKIWWAKGARVYHQHHNHCMPPIQHIPAILRNTEIFARKWGHRTMEHWLRAFRLMGLIDDNEGNLRIVREPQAADYDLCRQEVHMPYAHSGRVLAILEARNRVGTH